MLPSECIFPMLPTQPVEREIAKIQHNDGE
jgi:hypothetical protein